MGQRQPINKMRRTAALALGGFVLLLVAAQGLVLDRLPLSFGLALLGLITALGGLSFYGFLFQLIDRYQSRLERQNAELMALHRAALEIQSDRTLAQLLQKIVDQARQLVGSRYGALSVNGPGGEIDNFLVSGLSGREITRIGDPPRGHGLLGVVLEEGRHLRLADLRADPRSAGFPAHHPSMKSLLAVPIRCSSPFKGNLYLADKISADEFSPLDEDTLERFATQAAIAIDNLYLHEQLRQLAVAEERLRIAHEMHDGQAQILASVNAKAQTVREYLRHERVEEAVVQLDQLAAAARGVLADVRESIFALRTASRSDAALPDLLREFVDRWSIESGLPAAIEIDDGVPRFGPEAELQALRVAQEALTNVRKHSRGTRAWVRLETSPDCALRLTVEDDGVGIEVTKASRAGEPPRFGLATMRERAASIGGHLAVGAGPGGGTRVCLEVAQRRGAGGVGVPPAAGERGGPEGAILERSREGST